jgi:4-hydroxy-tetrahydrodipicolinate synthase
MLIICATPRQGSAKSGIAAMKLDRLKGSFPPLFTPFKHGDVDYDAYARLVERQVQEGSHGILVNGTSAEPATLTVEERNRLVDVAIAAARGRIPVVAATGSQSLFETRTLTEHAAQAGADALLIVTPYYTRPPQRGMVQYYLEAVRGIDVPWMVYHIPMRAAVTVTVDTIKELKDKSPGFVGMKHTAPDLDFVTECLAAAGPDFRLFCGLEDLSFPMMAVGACGLMNAVGNLQPRPLAEMCEAIRRGDMARAQQLHRELHGLNKAVFFETNPTPMKYMAMRMGILPRNEHRLPMAPATPELARKLDAVLMRAGLLPREAAE